MGLSALESQPDQTRLFIERVCSNHVLETVVGSRTLGVA